MPKDERPPSVAPEATASASSVHNDRLLADHLVRPEEDDGREREFQGLSSLEIEDELDLHRLLYRELGGFGTSEDFVYVGCDPRALPRTLGLWLMRHPASTNERHFTSRADAAGARGQRSGVDRGQRGVPQHDERLDLCARHRGKGTVERGGLAHLEAVELHLQRPGASSSAFHLPVKPATPGHRHPGDPRQRLLEQFQ